MRSFSPFYGLPVSTLQERLTEVEKIEETFTLVVHDGKIELQWNDDYARDVWIASRSRADKQINLMEPFIALLPSFRWVGSAGSGRIGSCLQSCARCICSMSPSELSADNAQSNIHNPRSADHPARPRSAAGAPHRGETRDRLDPPKRERPVRAELACRLCPDRPDQPRWLRGAS